MEKMPNLKIIGSGSEEKKREAEERFKNKLFDHINFFPEKIQEEIKKLEYPKTEEQISFISMANEETNRLMKSCDVESFNIPLDNFHIVPSEFYTKKIGKAGTVAVTLYNEQSIVFDANKVRGDNFEFAGDTFHETLHLKGSLVVQIEENDDYLKERIYRMGIDVKNTIKKSQKVGNTLYFDGLHEAIVSDQEKKFIRKLLELEEFKKEKEELNKEENIEGISGLSKEKNIPIDDFLSFKKDKDGKRSWKVVPYLKQREVYNYICEEILKENEDKYKDIEEVKKEFLKAHFTGNILPIARLVEESFGENSFRVLGGMGVESSGAIQTKELLRNMRRQVLKKNSK